mmetsp:Transcript_131554/g.293417  ORF Transcript_131554/g.293417 Transcript_131554/m.293417 type:complete len:256 (-) Transcript_131554:164-931(-)
MRGARNLLALIASNTPPTPHAIAVTLLILFEPRSVVAHHADVRDELEILFPQHDRLLGRFKRHHPTLYLLIPTLHCGLLVIEVGRALQANQLHGLPHLDATPRRSRLFFNLTRCPRLLDALVGESNDGGGDPGGLARVLGQNAVPILVRLQLGAFEEHGHMLGRHPLTLPVDGLAHERLFEAFVVTLLVAPDDERRRRKTLPEDVWQLLLIAGREGGDQHNEADGHAFAMLGLGREHRGPGRTLGEAQDAVEVSH